jgi:hypothetical protein
MNFARVSCFIGNEKAMLVAQKNEQRKSKGGYGETAGGIRGLSAVKSCCAVGSSDCDPLRPVKKKLQAGQLFDTGSVENGESHGWKRSIEEQEQRKIKRRKSTWGYSTTERAKS